MKKLLFVLGLSLLGGGTAKSLPPVLRIASDATLRRFTWLTNREIQPDLILSLRGARVGAAGSGTSMKAMQSIDGDHISLEGGTGVKSLEAGTIDAWIVDEFVGITAGRESGGRLTVLPEPVALEYYGFVLADDRWDLKARPDKGLAALEQDGDVARLQAEFGIERGPKWPVSW